MPDAWSGAASYERIVGRWSRKLAPSFVSWMGVPTGARVLDVGCGTGALSEALLAREPTSLVGVDLASPFVEDARRRLGGLRARFEVGDATALPVPDASFDVAASGLVLNFVHDPAQMAREMRRALVPGGLAALYVWDYAEGMQILRHFWDAAVAVDDAARPLDEGVRFPICAPERLHALFEAAGFVDVETGAVSVETRFSDFDDYWQPFLGGQGPASGYCVKLAEKPREALREALRRRVHVEPDGSLRMSARAWTVKGHSR